MGLIFFQGPFCGAYFWRGLYPKGLIYRHEREICVSKSIGLALKLEGNLLFLLCFTKFEGNFQVQAPGGLIFRGVI